MKPLTLLQVVSRLPCVGACPPPSFEDLAWVRENLNQAPRRSDPHHVTTVACGGKDTFDNVMPLCRRCHDEWHRIGGKAMAMKYQGVMTWLELAKRFDVLDGV